MVVKNTSKTDVAPWCYKWTGLGGSPGGVRYRTPFSANNGIPMSAMRGGLVGFGVLNVIKSGMWWADKITHMNIWTAANNFELWLNICGESSPIKNYEIPGGDGQQQWKWKYIQFLSGRLRRTRQRAKRGWINWGREVWAKTHHHEQHYNHHSPNWGRPRKKGNIPREELGNCSRFLLWSIPIPIYIL